MPWDISPLNGFWGCYVDEIQYEWGRLETMLEDNPGVEMYGVTEDIVHGNCGIRNAVAACRGVAEGLEVNWDVNWNGIQDDHPELKADLKKLKSLCNWACHSSTSRNYPHTVVTKKHMNHLLESLDTVVNAFEAQTYASADSAFEDIDLCEGLSELVVSNSTAHTSYSDILVM
jgi:hypothetical protein